MRRRLESGEDEKAKRPKLVLDQDQQAVDHQAPENGSDRHSPAHVEQVAEEAIDVDSEQRANSGATDSQETANEEMVTLSEVSGYSPITFHNYSSLSNRSPSGSDNSHQMEQVAVDRSGLELPTAFRQYREVSQILSVTEASDPGSSVSVPNTRHHELRARRRQRHDATSSDDTSEYRSIPFEKSDNEGPSTRAQAEDLDPTMGKLSELKLSDGRNDVFEDDADNSSGNEADNEHDNEEDESDGHEGEQDEE